MTNHQDGAHRPPLRDDIHEIETTRVAPSPSAQLGQLVLLVLVSFTVLWVLWVILSGGAPA
jgi:hypothetical protein